MKKIKLMLTIAVLATALFVIQSCENKKTKKSATTETKMEKTGKEYTSAYICPMHCKGSGSDKEGECPKCGMGYVKNENHKTN